MTAPYYYSSMVLIMGKLYSVQYTVCTPNNKHYTVQFSSQAVVQTVQYSALAALKTEQFSAKAVVQTEQFSA